MVDVWIMTASPARRDWFLNALSADSFIRVAGIATTFPFLRSLMAETSADIALIDLQFENDPAIFRDWLLELMDLVTIVVLIAEHDTLVFNRMMRAGAGGLLRRDASSEQVVQAIKSVAAGLTIFDSALMPQHSDDDSVLEPLTPREIEVLRLLADGLANREIASRLSISEHTIKFHIRSILGKLGASSRTEAVSRGLRSGLIEL
jgi:DNA-binding NarL/FixJ family response regulator